MVLYSPHQRCCNVEVVHKVVQPKIDVFHGSELVQVLSVVAASVLLPTPTIHFLNLEVSQSFCAVHCRQYGTVVTQSKQIPAVDV